MKRPTQSFGGIHAEQHAKGPDSFGSALVLCRITSQASQRPLLLMHTRLYFLLLVCFAMLRLDDSVSDAISALPQASRAGSNAWQSSASGAGAT